MPDDTTAEPTDRIHHELTRSMIGRLATTLDTHGFDALRSQPIRRYQRSAAVARCPSVITGACSTNRIHSAPPDRDFATQRLLEPEHRLIRRATQPKSRMLHLSRIGSGLRVHRRPDARFLRGGDESAKRTVSATHSRTSASIAAISDSGRTFRAASAPAQSSRVFPALDLFLVR